MHLTEGMCFISNTESTRAQEPLVLVMVRMVAMWVLVGSLTELTIGAQVVGFDFVEATSISELPSS